jgi:hypothetical protein
VSIYTWHNGGTSTIQEVHLRGDEAALVLPVDAKGREDALAKAQPILQQAGYKTAIGHYQEPSKFTLCITGNASELQKLEALANDKIREGMSVRLNGDTLEIGGLKQQEVPGFWSWAERKGFSPSKGFEIESRPTPGHEHYFLHVRGVEKGGETLFNTLEKSGLSHGERRDEFYGMSPIQKQWEVAKTYARSIASAFYLFGDSMVGLAAAQEAKRKNIGFWENPNSREFAGYFGGSMVMFAASLVKSPLVSTIVDRFKNTFRVGGEGEYDFSRSELLPEEGNSLGRWAETAKMAVANTGQEIHMGLATVFAAPGTAAGRYNLVMALQEKDGLRNVVLQDQYLLDGNRADVTKGLDKSAHLVNADGTTQNPLSLDNRGYQVGYRYRPQDLYSGLAVGAGSGIIITVPAKGVPHPIVDYQKLYDNARNTPVIGQVLGAAEMLLENPVGRALTYIPRKAVDFVRDDPMRLGGWLFMSHNIGQVIGGFVDYFKLNGLAIGNFRLPEALMVGPLKGFKGEIGEVIGQLSRERDSYAAGKPTVCGVDSIDSKIAEGSFTLDAAYTLRSTSGETKTIPLKEALESLCAATDRMPAIAKMEPKDVSKEFFREVIADYERKTQDRDYTLTDADKYMAVKAYNMQYCLDTHTERNSTFKRMSGYITFLVGHIFLKEGGEKEKHNLLEVAPPNLFAVTEEIASVIREETKNKSPETREAAIRNAGKFLHTQRSTHTYGLSSDELAELVSDKVEGKLSRFEEKLCKTLPCPPQPAMAQIEQPETEDKTNLRHTAAQQEKPKTTVQAVVATTADALKQVETPAHEAQIG